MKGVVLQSVCNNYEEIISLTSPINKRYAEIWDADYILHKQVHNHDRHPSWNKIYSTLDLMRSNKYDYIFFIDGDAIVTDSSRNIFSLGSDDPDKLIHVCSDGWCKKPLDSNWGVYLMKTDKLSIQFLEKILYSPAVDKYTNIEKKYYHKARDWEQSVIQLEFDQAIPFYKNIVKLYSSDTFNHYNGDWVYHPCGPLSDVDYKGPTNEQKAQLLLEKISQLTPDQKLYVRHDI